MANTKVTTGVIKDDAVGADQLASNSVVTASIVDNAITTAKINNDAILTAKISNSAVTNAKLSANSVDSDQYVDASIDTVHIRDGQITSAKLDTNISVAGTLTLGSHLIMGDNDILKMGASADLQIYHDGSNSYIKDTGTGRLTLQSATDFLIANTANTQNYIYAQESGYVRLYYAGATKLATTSSGIDVTGTANVGSISSGSASSASEITATSLDNGTSFGSNRMLKLIGTSTTDNSRMGIHFTGNTGIGNGLAIIEAVNEDQSAGHTSLRMHTYSGSWNENNLVLKSGSVGIGTDNPNGGKLHVVGNVFAEGGSYFVGANGVVASDSTSRDLNFAIGNTTPKMTLDTSGKVGIGETSPETSLHIKSAGNSFLTLERSGTTGGTGKFGINMEGGSSQQTTMAYDDGGKLVIGRSSDPATHAGFSNDFVLDSSGNCGIGTTSVSASRMQIKGANNNTAAFADGLKVTANNETVEMQYSWTGMNANDSMKFATTGTTRMSINSTGNILAGDATASGLLNLQKAGMTALVINTTTGTNNFVAFGRNGATVGSITTNGSTTSYNTSSDARLKDVTGEARGLKVINELNPVAYNWKEDGRADEGLIAQEVLDIVPNAVSGSEEEMYQMDYSKLVVHLVAGMKEQQTQIETLKQEIQELKG